MSWKLKSKTAPPEIVDALDEMNALDAGTLSPKWPPHPRVTIDLDRKVISLDGGGSPYELELDDAQTSHALLDWILQIASKPWATGSLLRELFNALEEACHLRFGQCAQGVYCCGSMRGQPDSTVAW